MFLQYCLQTLSLRRKKEARQKLVIRKLLNDPKYVFKKRGEDRELFLSVVCLKTNYTSCSIIDEYKLLLSALSYIQETKV